MNLRPYQLDAIARVRAALRGGARRPLLVAPTGSGKTIVATGVITSALKRGRRVLVLAHRRELISQPFCKLVRAGVSHDDIGIIMAGVPSGLPTLFPEPVLDLEDEDLWARLARRRPPAPVQIASIDTIRNRPTLPPADLVIVDECHRAVSKSYKELLEKYPDATVLGLTATPMRADGRGLGEMFDALILVASYMQLVEWGFLVEPRVFTVPVLPDLSGVRIKGGDYDQEQLEAVVDDGALVGNLVEHWKTHGNDAPTFVFAVSVKHSRHIVERFLAAGVAAEHIDADTPKDVRASALRRLRTGETKVLSNVDVCTEGTDVPVVKTIVLARPTRSLRIYMQAVGRGSRPSDNGLPFVVLDHAGNAPAHGLPQEERDWSLEGRKRRKGAAAPVKTCFECYAINPANARVCVACGEPFEDGAAEREEPEERDGKLVEVRRLTEEEKRATWDRLVADWYADNERRAKPRKPGWLAFRWRELNLGPLPRSFPRPTMPPAVAARRARFDSLAETAEQHGYDPQWAYVQAERAMAAPAAWPRVDRPGEAWTDPADDFAEVGT